MPRRARHAPADLVYHVLNRGVGRQTIFHKDEDYAAFERIMIEAMRRFPTRLLGYCLMPNHWHMILWPRTDEELTEFVRWLTHTHTQRYHAHYHTSGTGHVYQGRFKSFPIEADPHLLIAWRYVERNALRAGLVKRAEDWRHGSLWRRLHLGRADSLLCTGPIDLPADWVQFVNEPQTDAELEMLRSSVLRSSPFGSDAWRERTAKLLGLESTLRPQGRPRKSAATTPGMIVPGDVTLGRVL